MTPSSPLYVSFAIVVASVAGPVPSSAIERTFEEVQAQLQRDGA